MKLESTLALRFTFNQKTLWNESLPLAILGLIMGVACLVVSMAVMSGFEYTLQKAMTDVTGHITIIHRGKDQQPWQKVEEKIKASEPEFLAAMPFTYIEAIIARKGQAGGVMIQGIKTERAEKVLHLRERIIEGDLNVEPSADSKDSAKAILGKSLATNMGLKVGDTFKVIVPLPHEIDPTQFRRKLGTFYVSGVLDFGKHDLNERLIVTDIKTTQELAEVGDRYTGMLLRFTSSEEARHAAIRLYDNLGPSYWVRDWRETNENLFKAVDIERWVIFFVVLIIVLVAAFNVSSSLFVNVIRRYPDIGILKSLGIPNKSLVKIFSFQGLAIGAIGISGGFLLGWILCLLFTYYQNRFQLISGAVYKIDSIDLNLRGQDLFLIIFCTLLICFLAALAPAIRGAKIQPTQGLRYE